MLLLLPTTGFAQMKNRQHPVDTLVTSDGLQRVVLFSNGTWKYIGFSSKQDQENAEAKAKEQPKIAQAASTKESTTSTVKTGSSAVPYTPGGSVFEEDWDEENVSVYHGSLSELPSNIEIQLTDGEASSFHSPITGSPSSRYGYRSGRRHTGTDVPLTVGDPIYSAFDGKVRISKSNAGGYGNLVVIRHANGLETYYGHLSKSNVEPGQAVKAGDVIGQGGNTGRSTGPHLHFETRFQGFPFDPERIINFASGELRSPEFELRQSYFGANSRYVASGNYTPSSQEDSEGESKGRVITPEPVKKTTTTQPSSGYKKQQASAGKSTGGKKSSTTKKQTNKPVYHNIEKGDNLTTIAKKNGTTVEQLRKLNPQIKGDKISSGKSIRVK